MKQIHIRDVMNSNKKMKIELFIPLVVLSHHHYIITVQFKTKQRYKK